MSNFNRGLNQDFVNALKNEYTKNEWWTNIVDDSDLFIAIRNNYINVYYCGNSVLKLNFDGNKFTASTHYKYLLIPKSESPVLIETNEPGFSLPENWAQNYTVNSLASIDSIKKSSRYYAGVEKEGIQQIIKSNKNILDLEIALTNEGVESEYEDYETNKLTAKRIDFTALQKNNDVIELLFFEAKHFSNGELRAEKDTLPDVIKKQISTYEKLLVQYEPDIEASYQRVCQNFCDILPEHGVDPLIKEVIDGHKIKINTKPRLVIFGFDDDQKKGLKWAPHKKKLMEELGKERLLLKGVPKGFINGIASRKK